MADLFGRLARRIVNPSPQVRPISPGPTFAAPPPSKMPATSTYNQPAPLRRDDSKPNRADRSVTTAPAPAARKPEGVVPQAVSLGTRPVSAELHGALRNDDPSGSAPAPPVEPTIAASSDTELQAPARHRAHPAAETNVGNTIVDLRGPDDHIVATRDERILVNEKFAADPATPMGGDVESGDPEFADPDLHEFRTGIPAKSQPAADTEVNVTIGTIEVRAILPDAPEKSRTASRPAPRMTLEDYQRKRSGGPQ